MRQGMSRLGSGRAGPLDVHTSGPVHKWPARVGKVQKGWAGQGTQQGTKEAGKH